MASPEPWRPTYWDRRDQERVERLVSRLVSTRGPTGWSMTDEYEFVSQALMSLLRFTGPIRKPWSVVGKALAVMAEASDQSLTGFEAAVGSELAQRHAEYQAKGGPCWLILPLRLPAGVGVATPRVIRVLGRDFGIMRVDDLPGYMGVARDGADEETRLILSESKPSVLVCVAGNGFPTESVYDEFAPAFDALRGGMELVLHLGESRISWGSSGAWGSVPHPRRMFCLRPGRPVDGLSFVGTPDWDPTTLVSRRAVGLLDRLEELMGHLRERPGEGSTEELIGDLLRLYAQAMEQSERGPQLLALWQLAEALTLKRDEKGAGERVVARLASFGRFMEVQPAEAVQLTLALIMDMRNEAVHRGLHGGVDDSHVNLLKRVCEIGLRWLILNREKLPTRAHLAHWWTHFALHQEGLRALSETAAFIELERRSAKDEG